MGMQQFSHKEEIFRLYKKCGIKTAIEQMLKIYDLRNLKSINEMLQEFAEFSKIKDLKIEEFQTYIEKSIYYSDLLERTRNKYDKMEVMDNIDQAYYELWEEELKNRINLIAKKFNIIKSDSINSMEVSEFVKYIFDKDNWFKDATIILFIHDYCKSNNLNTNINDKIVAIINAILKDKDSLEATLLSDDMATHLRNKIEANETIVENYLKCKIKDRDEMLQRNKEEQEKADFIQSVLECYKTKGLREALIKLHSDGSNLEEDFQMFIKKLYSQNDIIFVANNFWYALLKNMQLAKDTTKNILDSCKGYKGEIPKYLQEKLNQNNTLYNENLDELVKIINKDFNERVLYQYVNLPLKDYINATIEATGNPTKQQLFTDIINYCVLRGITLPLTENLDYCLQEVIRNITIKKETEGTTTGPFNLSDDYLKISVDKLVAYIKDSTNQNVLNEEEHIYYEINELTEENKELYNQIENLYKRIEVNEDKKRELTLKHQNILLKK